MTHRMTYMMSTRISPSGAHVGRPHMCSDHRVVQPVTSEMTTQVSTGSQSHCMLMEHDGRACSIVVVVVTVVTAVMATCSRCNMKQQLVDHSHVTMWVRLRLGSQVKSTTSWWIYTLQWSCIFRNSD